MLISKCKVTQNSYKDIFKIKRPKKVRRGQIFVEQNVS